MPIVKLAYNAVVAKLINPSKEVRAFVTTLLSYEVEGGFRGGSWSGRSTFYDTLKDTFPAGFVNVVQAELTKLGHTIYPICEPLPAPLGPESPKVDEFGNDDPRYDYQLQALRQVEKHGAGIIRVATGGGKSKIAKLIMARYNRPTLFLTTRGILLYQMETQLRDMGLKTGQVGDGEMRFVKGVNLGMVQTLVQTIQEPMLDAEVRAVLKGKAGRGLSDAQVRAVAQASYDRKKARRDIILRFLELVQVVIGEEAHEAGGQSYYEILRYCKNARIRVALTATPFMRAQAEDNMRLMAAFGPVLIDVSEDLLIKRGILAKPYFRFKETPAPALLSRGASFDRAYTLGYVENEALLAEMVKDALKAKSVGLPVLTLISRKKHGETVEAAMRAAGLRAVFLKGEDDMEGRRRALQQLSQGKIDVIIGTTILDVGVDVPAIGLVQLAGGMKAEVAMRQRVGRGLRAKKKGPNVAFIIDYSCGGNLHLRKHAAQRRAIIESTPGFAEGILPANKDFDWSLFSVCA